MQGLRLMIRVYAVHGSPHKKFSLGLGQGRGELLREFLEAQSFLGAEVTVGMETAGNQCIY